MSGHRITVEKPKARFRVTITFPSGKKETRWVESKLSVDQICQEYAVPADQILWQPMKGLHMHALVLVPFQ